MTKGIANQYNATKEINSKKTFCETTLYDLMKGLFINILINAFVSHKIN